ncbi:LytTR family two component transcriptional regulator [Arcticibacter tournemirensis]|uniref:Response regulator transcription factor n=1 Tax=Arcticibacter tournemirensis TaxID=699437 RepID=A0A5M9HCX1_9SPHI|nr:LytTR family DNA-binding domain-containing protein [Arcticibacter tournemirensis]KAA8482727.1 response regulator transcription factor [Arcticibacter tournemirensis]TQM51021.1 LytTR family two component transcriptional regulator [Arcticibacter tournemirensis]
MILKCIAVDDEPLALGLICSFIEQTPFLQLVGKYSSAAEALQNLHELKPDILFLDVQMPDLSGMELARILSKTSSSPAIIFTTAFNHFALEGYKVNALDYLLKPFNYEEFLGAANKALSLKELKEAFGTSKDTEGYSHCLFLKSEYQLVKVQYKDILYIEGLKDYAKVYLNTGEKPILSLISLKSLEQKLPSQQFIRVHRSYIIPLDKIKSVTRNTVQIGDKYITVGDQYKEAFNNFLSRWM